MWSSFQGLACLFFQYWKYIQLATLNTETTNNITGVLIILIFFFSFLPITAYNEAQSQDTRSLEELIHIAVILTRSSLLTTLHLQFRVITIHPVSWLLYIWIRSELEWSIIEETETVSLERFDLESWWVLPGMSICLV